MAKFLTGKRLVSCIDEIIEEAEEKLVLISPYIKADDETKGLLKNKTRSTSIDVIYGKKELNPEEKSFFNSLGIKTSFLKNLHAKCYLNEKEALLTSLNLLESSQKNDEMGILVSKKDDKALYDAMYKQAMTWKTVGAEVVVAQGGRARSASAVTRSWDRRAQRAPKKPKSGFCIRCKDDLRANPERPYCADCYRVWNLYGNETYEEKYCHTCGKNHEATLLKPVCLACYRKYKDVFEFAAG